MSIAIGDNLKSAFGYASDNSFKEILRWIVLSILLMIPIVNFIPVGIFLRTLRNEEPNFTDTGKAFSQGFFFSVITLIYLIVPLIAGTFLIIIAFIPAAYLPIAIGSAVSSVLIVILTVILAALLIIIPMLLYPAAVRYSRSGRFSEAFKFKKISAMIKNVGVGHYILSFIVIILIIIAVSAVLSLVSILPLGNIVVLLAQPFLIYLGCKFFANLFDPEFDGLVDEHPEVPAEERDGLPTASLVLGIFSIIMSVTGFGIIMSVLSVVFGGCALHFKYPQSQKSIAGIITGVIGFIIPVFLVIIIFSAAAILCGFDMITSAMQV